MASWDTPVVNAPTTANYAAPIVDWSQINNLQKRYYEGAQMQREQDKATAFRNGIPRDSNGDPDFNKISDTAAKVGGIDYALPLLNLQVQRDAGAGNAAAVANAQGVATGQQPSAPARSSQAPVAAAQQPREAPQASGPATVMTILAAQGIPNDQLQAAADSVSRQLGVGPTDAIDTKDPQVRNVLGPAIQRIKGVGMPTQTAEAPVEPAASPVQRIAQGADAAPVASGDMATADRLDLAAAGLRQRAAATANLNPKGADALIKQADAFGERAKQIREQIGTSNQPAPSIKEWRQSGSNLPYDEWVAAAKADGAGAAERAKADVKEQQEYISAGKQASNRLSTLNSIGNIVNSDKNLTLGYGGDTALKIKMALQQLGIPVGDLSGAEGIQKMNASLASEMAKSLSGRPTQFEFKSFMANNPGLLLDKAGNQRLIGIYSQLAQREYQLGKLARQSTDNWSNWDNIVEKYDAKHPIIDPISKQPISTNSVIAPGANKSSTPANTPALEPGKTMMNGYVYKGGDPNNKANWEPRA